MHPVELFMPLYYVLYAIYEVTGHLTEGSFVGNVVVQIPKFDAKPNPNSNPNPSHNLTLTLVLTLTQTLTLTLTLAPTLCLYVSKK